MAALEELLCALLALSHAAEAARHEPAGKLRPTAAWVAAHATGAWLACHQDVDSLPPLVWDEGGESESQGRCRAHGLALRDVFARFGAARRQCGLHDAGRAGVPCRPVVSGCKQSVCLFVSVQLTCLACPVKAKVPAHSSASRLAFRWSHASSITLVCAPCRRAGDFVC